MKTRYLLAAVVLVALGIRAIHSPSAPGVAADARPKPGRILYYRDPMHPAYTSDKPGTAPDCGMPLEPVFAPQDDEPSAEPRAGAVHITPDRQQLIGIRTTEVQRRTTEHWLRLPGRVAADENRIYRVTTKAEGWIREIFPSTTGALVRKGQPLVSVYGRDFRAAQQSYIFALNMLDRAAKSDVPDAPELPNVAAEQNKVSAAEALANLQNMGMDPVQIREIAETRQAVIGMRLTSPVDGFIVARNVFPDQRFSPGVELYRVMDLRRVWIVADAYADDARHLRSGSMARVTPTGHVGRALQAQVSDVLPQFDATTRTLKVRLEVANPGFSLRPDMFVHVELPVRLGPAVTVPADALIDSGRSKTAFVDRGNGFFEPRDVVTGWRFDNDIEVISGLQPGERVVTAATFLVESESKLQRRD